MEHFLLIFLDLVKNLLIYPDSVEKKSGGGRMRKHPISMEASIENMDEKFKNLGN
jgi:hypothetical protein